MNDYHSTAVQFSRDEPLADHCRFRIGGPADWFCQVSSCEQLQQALAFAKDNELRHFVYAGGSNLFFADEGFRGLVIRFVNGGCKVSPDRKSVHAAAGFDLPTLVRNLAILNLGGLEFLGNIPGSIGGAVVGNAGCYGREIAGVLSSAKVFEVDGARLLNVEPEYFEFSYRHSRLKHDDSKIVVSATLRLEERTGTETLAEVEQELGQRLSKHPHEAWCGGSFFKNPDRSRPAWQVIQEAGLAAAAVGGAGLSAMHANFLINTGDATSRDVIELVRLIRQGVSDKLGINLIPEVRYVGPEGIAEIE